MPEEKNLLIKENKQVADLNRVPGFDPAKLLQKSVKGQEGASDQVPQLMLKYKKLWFRLACPNGRIRLVARHLTEKIAVVEAEIYRDKADPVPVSNFVASRTAHDRQRPRRWRRTPPGCSHRCSRSYSPARLHPHR